MIHRIALLLGGLVAVGVLAFGVIRGDRPAIGAPADEGGQTAAADVARAPAPREVVDTVYVAAPRAPEVIRVTRRAKPARQKDPAPPRAARRRDRDDDDEREGREHERHEREGREHERHEREDD